MRLHRSAERIRSDIVRLAHAGLDSISLRREAATRMLRVIPAASYGFGTLDPSTLLLTSTVRDNISDDAVPRLVKNEYAEDDYNKLADLAARRLLVGRLSIETQGKLTHSRRYRQILAPLGWGDEMRALFVSGNSCWGFICLHREGSDRSFTAQEASFLAGLSVHLGEGLRKSLLLSSNISAAHCEERSPGLIELTEDLQMGAMNGAAERWLAEIEHHPQSKGTLPQAIHAVVAQLQALELNPASALPPRLQVRAKSGRWLVLHATRLQGPRSERRIAVIIEPAAPIEVAPLVARAYALSERETEICLLVMRGLATADISLRLHISPNTIQDHLKAIFDKVGARSRRELVSHIFDAHYHPLQPQPRARGPINRPH